MKKDQHKGQVALVLVLVMTVASALAVSLASRSTVDTRIQQTETQSVQALLNAQTGIEQLILNQNDFEASEVDKYKAVRTDIGSNSFDIGRVDSGSSVEINLEGADFVKLTAFKVYWKPDTGNPSAQPAVFISTIKDTGVISDYAYSYDGINGFLPASDTSDYGYVKVTSNIPLTPGVSKIIRITTLGSAALMRVVPIGASAIFPSQSRSIKSVGSVKSEDDTVKYGLQYNESLNDTVPAVFDYALFSGGSIIQ